MLLAVLTASAIHTSRHPDLPLPLHTLPPTSPFRPLPIPALSPSGSLCCSHRAPPSPSRGCCTSEAITPSCCSHADSAGKPLPPASKVTGVTVTRYALDALVFLAAHDGFHVGGHQPHLSAPPPRQATLPRQARRAGHKPGHLAPPQRHVTHVNHVTPP